jgi:hypothetical protein
MRQSILTAESKIAICLHSSCIVPTVNDALDIGSPVELWADRNVSQMLLPQTGAQMDIFNQSSVKQDGEDVGVNWHP